MNFGYIKLHRKILESGLMHNPKLFTFWSYCLLKASHKERSIMIGYQDINLRQGQFIFGRKKATDEIGLSQQEIRTCLKKLEKSGKITINPTNKFSVITIVNWSTYQSEKDGGNHQLNQQLTNKQPASNQQLTTDKKGKKGKNVKNDKMLGVFNEFLDIFNSQLKTKYRGDSKTKRQFVARIKDGFCLSDFKKAISAAKNNSFLMGKNDSGKRYLTPEYISRADKLDEYLNQPAKGNGNSSGHVQPPPAEEVLRQIAGEAIDG